MGTVSVRMPDEEIEELEKIAEKRGKSRSALIREIAEKELERNSVSELWDLVGILSDEEAEKLREAVKENREKTTESLKKRAEKGFEE